MRTMGCALSSWAGLHGHTWAREGAQAEPGALGDGDGTLDGAARPWALLAGRSTRPRDPVFPCQWRQHARLPHCMSTNLSAHLRKGGPWLWSAYETRLYHGALRFVYVPDSLSPNLAILGLFVCVSHFVAQSRPPSFGGWGGRREGDGPRQVGTWPFGAWAFMMSPRPSNFERMVAWWPRSTRGTQEGIVLASTISPGPCIS
ncbi:hypothetical protein BT67DRAFT_303763 [Trichocladium antarcticum]|uniref:Uncharacterized protein n=1 Tax=Trichocladium antarcticum TaxID=1450529 RepID=A0AAN6UL37_9PEZI|nr:hypothetical protein BT67DRAFT_303763 [Trichocladium antarcticum]